MAWYKTGTVTVTNGSATVTGAGTAFVGSVLAGQGFAAPDGKIYEIDTVVSATQITLASPYLGATAAGAAYTILPTIGGLSSFASRLDTLLTAMQGVVDGAGQGKFGAGTPAAPGLRFTADGDTGFTNPTANQIGMVTGGTRRALLSNTALQLDVALTGTAVTQSAIDVTAGRLLKVGDFGLGNALNLGAGDNLDTLIVPGFYYNSTAANTPGNNYPFSAAGSLLNIRKSSSNWTQRFVTYASTSTQIRIFERSIGGSGWSPWVELFHQGSIVGTVSQAAGVPTGKVVERGSNANGDYVRFADGTQICWGSVDCGSILAEGGGTAANPYRTAAVNASFAAAFSVAPVVPQPQFTDGGGTSPQDRAVTATYSNNATGVTVLRLHRTTTSAVATTFTASFMAIGRWF
jgi:hypothetical protein